MRINFNTFICALAACSHVAYAYNAAVEMDDESAGVYHQYRRPIRGEVFRQRRLTDATMKLNPVFYHKSSKSSSSSGKGSSSSTSESASSESASSESASSESADSESASSESASSEDASESSSSSGKGGSKSSKSSSSGKGGSKSSSGSSSGSSSESTSESSSGDISPAPSVAPSLANVISASSSSSSSSSSKSSKSSKSSSSKSSKSSKSSSSSSASASASSSADESPAPTLAPSVAPSPVPSAPPTSVPSIFPTRVPTSLPSAIPSLMPSFSSERPSNGPTPVVSENPSGSPTISNEPTIVPSVQPSSDPTTSEAPSVLPSSLPSNNPTVNAMNFRATLALGTVPQAYRSAFDAAAVRWGEIIVGDMPDNTEVSQSVKDMSSCSDVPDYIDDLFICGDVAPIDGEGGILGSAGPEVGVQVEGFVLPLMGSMKFDSEDVAQLMEDNMYDGLVLHEMGHVIGLGTLWSYNGLVLDVDGTCTYAEDTKATEIYQELSGCTTNTIPLEQEGGSGTACGHWDEECFQGELTTGYSSGKLEISAVTIGALEDLGYTVDYDKADAYTKDDLDPSCKCSLGHTRLGGPTTSFGPKPKPRPKRDGGASVGPVKLGGIGTTTERREPKEEKKKEGSTGIVSLGHGNRRKRINKSRGGGRRKLSDAGRAEAVSYGKNVLRSKKKPPVFSLQKLGATKGTVYLADKIVNVLYMEEGEIYRVAVRAD